MNLENMDIVDVSLSDCEDETLEDIELCSSECSLSDYRSIPNVGLYCVVLDFDDVLFPSSLLSVVADMTEMDIFYTDENDPDYVLLRKLDLILCDFYEKATSLRCKIYIATLSSKSRVQKNVRMFFPEFWSRVCQSNIICAGEKFKHLLNTDVYPKTMAMIDAVCRAEYENINIIDSLQSLSETVRTIARIAVVGVKENDLKSVETSSELLGLPFTMIFGETQPTTDQLIIQWRKITENLLSYLTEIGNSVINLRSSQNEKMI